MVGATDAVFRIPQTKCYAGADDGADGKRLRRSEDLARNQVVAGVLVVGGLQHAR